MRFLIRALTLAAVTAAVGCYALSPRPLDPAATLNDQASALYEHLLELLHSDAELGASESVTNNPLLQTYGAPFSSLDASENLNAPSTGVFRSHERLLADVFAEATVNPVTGPDANADGLSSSLHQRLYDWDSTVLRTLKPNDASFTATPAGIAALAEARAAILATTPANALTRASASASASALGDRCPHDLLRSVPLALPPVDRVLARRRAARALALDPSTPEHAGLLAATADAVVFPARRNGAATAAKLALLSSLPASQRADMLRYIAAGEPSTFACQQCQLMLNAIKDIIGVLAPPTVIKIMKPLCKTASQWIVPLVHRPVCDPAVPGECQAVCEGIMESWGGVAVELVAGLVLNPRLRCTQARACPADDPDTPIQPPFPATVVERSGPPRARGTSRILQLSDVHLDEFYEPGSRAECKMPVCCRGKAPAGTELAGPFGAFLCDAPEVLVQSAFAEIPLRNVSHVVFTGDSPAHDLWMQTKEGNLAVELKVTDWALEAAGVATAVHRAGATVHAPHTQAGRRSSTTAGRRFVKPRVSARDAAATELWQSLFRGENAGRIPQPSVPRTGRTAAANADADTDVRYWPVLGNHAGAPVDQFGGPAKDHWLYGAVAKNWSRFLPRSAVVSLTWGGFYTAVMEPGLHVIALQTNYYDPMNLYLLYAEHPDLAGQLGWLEHVLAQIEALGEKAIIIAHEPADTFATGYWPKRYLEIFSRYAKTITGSLFGHVHSDMFHVISKQSAAALTGQSAVAAAPARLAASALTGAGTLAASASAPAAAAAARWLRAQAAAVLAPSNNAAPLDPSTLVPIGSALLPSAVSPLSHSTNPSYRVYTLDPLTKELTDYEQYRADLVAGNSKGYLEWFMAYTAREGYGMKDLSPRSLLDLALRVLGSEEEYQFVASNYYGGLNRTFTGDASTKERMGCTSATTSDADKNACLEFYRLRAAGRV
jgi:hypothetical protein